MLSCADEIQTTTWMLDQNITYLNHGSFGARPIDVFEAQLGYKKTFEASPIDFLDRNRDLLAKASETASKFVGCDIEGFGFVENATTGVGCVMKSISLEEGSEILTTNHVYNGIRKLLQHHAETHALTYRECNITLPVESSADILQTISEAITDSTKLLVVDHVSSSTAIVFPVEQIVNLCRDKGILILVDGAHAPGMLDLNVEQINADWYVGNFHKWVCAPLGAAFVWTNTTFRDSTHPMTISHNLHESYANEFEWQGTRDISSWLAVSDAIAWGERIGWVHIRDHNHELAVWMQQKLVDTWKVEPISPIDGSMLGSMVTVFLPPEFPQKESACLEFRDSLYRHEQIEANIFSFEGRGMIRLSAQLYVQQGDVDHLLKKLRQ